MQLRIKRRQSFPVHAGTALLFFWLWPQSLLAAFPDISFKAARVEFESFVFESVRGERLAGGGLALSADLLSAEGLDQSIRSLGLNSPQLQSEEELWCPNGEWQLEIGGLHKDRPLSPVSGTLAQIMVGSESLRLSGDLAVDGLEADLLYVDDTGGSWAEFHWTGQQIRGLQGLSLAPAELNWVSRGSSRGSLVYTPSAAGGADIRYSLALEDFAFDSPEGQIAGEALRLESQGTLVVGAAVAADVRGRIIDGELLLGDFYRNFSDAPLEFAAQPFLNGSDLSIKEVKATDHSALTLEGSAQLNLDDPENSLAFRIQRLELKFPGAYERYFETMAGVWALNGLDLTGSISWNGDWADGAFQSGVFELSDLTIVDNKRKRFAVTGLDATLRPGDHDYHSRMGWRGLLLGQINLGGGEIALDSEPGRFAITAPLELQFLGGRSIFQELGLLFPVGITDTGCVLDIKLRAELIGLDMERLTS